MNPAVRSPDGVDAEFDVLHFEKKIGLNHLPLLFLVFKTSAVRHDGLHYIRWILFLVSVGILYGARNWAVIQAPRWGWW